MPSLLEALELWFSQWTSKSANKFNLLKINKNLTNLEFHKCYAGFDEVICVVADALHNNTTMRMLSMPQGYRISGYTVGSLSRMVQNNRTLEKLEVTLENPYCYASQNVFTLDSALQKNNSLKVLGLHLAPNRDLIFDDSNRALDPRITFCEGSKTTTEM